MKNRQGITMISIIVYVVLFFIFTVTVTVISTNFNAKLFEDRGLSINTNSFNKLQHNLLMSSNDSNLASIIDGELVFSNNDSYTYDSVKKTVKKNGGVLVSNVTAYETVSALGDNGSLITVSVKFGKYLNNDVDFRVIKVFVEGV